MAEFFWQPDPEDEGNPPGNAVIIQPWDSFTELRVVADGTAGGHSLEMRETTGNSGFRAALFTELNGVAIPDSANVEVYMRFVASGASNEYAMAARADDSSTNAHLYYGGLRRAVGHGAIRKIVEGSASTIDSAGNLDQGFDVYKQRLRVNGSDLSLKVWLASDPEPIAWDLTATDTDITAAGKVGYFQQLTTSSFHGRILDLGVGTDGDEAPTEPVDDDSVVIGGARVETQLEAVPGAPSAGVAQEDGPILSFQTSSGDPVLDFQTGVGESASVIVGGVRVQTQIDSVAGMPIGGVALESIRKLLSLDTRSGVVLTGVDVPVTVTGQRAGLTLGSVAGETKSGLLAAGEAAQLAITPLPGGMVAGNAFVAVRVSMELTARTGSVIAGTNIPVTIVGDRASLSLSSASGSVASGIVLSGSDINLSLETQSGGVVVGRALDSEAVQLSIEPKPGSLLLGHNIPGTSVELGLSPGDGVVTVGSLLEGANVLLSVSPRSPDLVRGQVIDGNAALMDLLANPGEMFTGLLLVTPIRRTAAIDISPRYNVVKLKT